MQPYSQKILLALVFIALFLQFFSPRKDAESARQYQYKVINISSATELRTQTDAEKGRVAAIETVINEQVAQGWDFFQADGTVLYFRR